MTTRDLAECERFLTEQGALGRNLYVQPNVCRPDLGDRRVGKADVAAATFVHVDLDPPHFAGPDAATQLTAWQRETAAPLAQWQGGADVGLPAPSAVVFSGSGFQILWRLRPFIALWRDGAQDPEAVALVEGINLALLRAVAPECPGTQNVDRLLRVPGTLNHPSAKKLEAGRVGPVLATVTTRDAAYPVDVFPREVIETPRAVHADVPPAGAPSGGGGQFDIAAFLARVAPGTSSVAVSGGTRWDVECPWIDQHSSKSRRESSVFADDAGKLGYKCMHSHCAEKTWADFRAFHDPSYVTPAAREAAAEEMRPFLDWMDANAGVAASPPPSDNTVEAHLCAARDRLKRSSDGDKRAEGVLIGRVLRGDLIVDKRELAEAAIACVRHLRSSRHRDHRNRRIVIAETAAS